MSRVINSNFGHILSRLTFLCEESSFFSGGRRKTFLFLKDGRFRRSRSSKDTDIGANRNRICDFLLVRNSNLGPILHRFGNVTAFMCS